MSNWLLVHEDYREGISRQLEARAREINSEKRSPSNDRAFVVRHAVSIKLPEIHTFADADGAEFAVCGWDREDAKMHLSQDPRVKPPLEWRSSSTVWPGMYVAYLGRAYEEGSEG